MRIFKLFKILSNKKNNYSNINLRFCPVKIKKGFFKNHKGKYIRKAWYKKEIYVSIAINSKQDCEKYVYLKENYFKVLKNK